MKVLIACEYSGRVRDAFTAKGHYAVSCDLLPSESPGGLHYQGDVMDILNEGWDLLIAHPPCTYLTIAGNRAFKDNPERFKKRDEAIDFVKNLWNCDISQICIENPVGFLNTMFKRPNQIIHPYYFGDSELKRTCLWLKGLPKLVWTVNSLYGEKIKKPEPLGISPKGEKYWFCAMASGEKWKVRSRTFPGIAAAMAKQWG